jgi:hypothetical protein
MGYAGQAAESGHPDDFQYIASLKCLFLTHDIVSPFFRKQAVVRA